MFSCACRRFYLRGGVAMKRPDPLVHIEFETMTPSDRANYDRAISLLLQVVKRVQARAGGGRHERKVEER
jgi:hypothetical protein